MTQSVKILLAGVLVATAAVAIAIRLHRASVPERLARSGVVLTYTYRCTACGAVFTLEDREVRALISQGRTVAKPGHFRLFPCSACGKMTAAAADGAQP